METDWELKDRRIAWMNCNTSASVIISARINAGLFKPKDNKEAMKELLDAIGIEFGAFLSIVGDKPVSPGIPVKSETPKQTTNGKLKDTNTKDQVYVCTDCNLDITWQEMKYSEKFYGVALCRNCQQAHGKKEKS